MHSCFKKWILALAVVIISHSATGNLQPGNAEQVLDINYSDGLIDLEVKNQPLGQVLGALTSKTGIKAVYLTDIDLLPLVSASLARVTLQQCIDILLMDVNRLVVYTNPDQVDQARQPAQIWILGRAEEQSEFGEIPGQQARVDDSKARSEALLGLLNDQGLTVYDAVNTLVKSLREDHSALVRTRAALALAQLGDASAVPALIEALSDESDSVRNQSMQALGQIGNQTAVIALGEILLKSNRELDRVLAVMALNHSDNDLAREYLSIARNDSSEQVRAYAAPKDPDKNFSSGGTARTPSAPVSGAVLQ